MILSRCVASTLSTTALILTLAPFASAETTPAERAQWPCASERQTLCSSKTQPEEVLRCLFENRKSLSEQCTQDLERFVAAKRQASQAGGGALATLGAVNAFGPPIPMVSYDGHFIPAENGSPRQSENRFGLSVPVYKTASDSLALSAAGGQVDFSSDQLLDSGKTVSNIWTRYELGAQFTHQSADHSMWSAKASVGYAGDDPSEMPKDATYSLLGTYGFLGSGTDYWVLLVFIGNNSSLANYIPVPGVIYIHKTEHFTGMFGFPVLSMQWTPVDPWQFSLSVLGVTAQAEAAYGRNFAQVFLGYAYTIQSFIPENRDDNKLRFVVHEEKIGPGVRVPLGLKNLVEFQTGYSFDRSLSLETSLFAKNEGSTQLQPGLFANISLKHGF